MFRFLLFITFLILIQKLIKTLQEQQKEQKEPSEEETKDYFQSLEFPTPEEIPSEPKQEKLEKLKEPVIAKREIKRPEIKIAEFKPTRIEVPPKQAEEELPTFSQDKLEEGIILSAILGPPKAYQIRRSVETGIRSGLKNRRPKGHEGSTPSSGII